MHNGDIVSRERVKPVAPMARRVRALLAVAALGALTGAAHADFPDHSLHLVVPFAPGGAVDGAARPAASELGKALGQAVVVDNKPGSGGTIGIQYAQNAAADGYTLLLGNIALASAPALHPNAGIVPKDFAPVALIGTTPYALVVPVSSKVKTLGELVADAKANPGKLNYGSAGPGSAIHLAGELFNEKAGVKIVHVPYKGAGPAMTALLGGEVDMMFGSVMELKPMLQAGRLRALAVTSSARSTQLPEVPTLVEAGVKDYEVTGWYGVYVIGKTPPEVQKKLREAAQKGLRSESARQQLMQYGLEPSKGDAKEAQDMLSTETTRWSAVVKSAGIKAN